MKRFPFHAFAVVATLVALSFGLSQALLAQGDQLALSLQRTVGYSLGSQIQGLFTVSVSGPADLASVSFLMDGKQFASVTSAPFRVSLNTDQYPSGVHQLTAEGKTTTGRTLTSNTVSAEFLSAGESGRQMFSVIGAIIGAIVVVMLLVVGFQVLVVGNKVRTFDPNGPVNYGVAGGTVCSHCGRPFALNFMAPNLVLGKLQRCPYCGSWGMRRRASPQALEQARLEQVKTAGPAVPELSAEEQLRRKIEESKYG